MKKIPLAIALLATLATLATHIDSAGADAPSFATPDIATFSPSTWASTGLDGSAAVNDTSNGDTLFIDNYYSPSDRWLETYADAGSTIHLSWHVTSSNGTPLANQPVTLIGNLAYACSTGVTWNISTLNVYPGCGGGPDGTLAGTTDANGNVTFTLVNTNTSSGTRPSDMTTTTGAEENESNYPWTRFVLEVGSDTFTADPDSNVNQATDLVDVIIIPDAAPSAGLTPTFATPTPTSGGFTDQITNYNAAYGWSASSTAGTASISSTGLVTVTGLSVRSTATVTVSTSRSGYANANASVTGTSSAVALVAPTAPVVASPTVVSRGSVQWTWSDSASVTSYTWNGACSGSGNVTSVTCTGLQGGSVATLSVTATNASGTSSAGFNSLTLPVTSPDPVAATDTPGNGAIAVAWKAPFNGGAAITSYTVNVRDASGTLVASTSLKASVLATTVSGLTNGSAYSVTVVATNSAHLTSSAATTSNVIPLSASKVTVAQVKYIYGASQLVFSAKVSGSPSGSVSFTAGGVSLCTATLANGTALCGASATTLSAGTYVETASYSGNATTRAATGTASLSVSASPSTLSLTPSADSITTAALPSFSVVTGITSPSGLTPPGSIILRLDGTVLSSSAGTYAFSSFNTSSLATGRHVLQLTYAGSTNFKAATISKTFNVTSGSTLTPGLTSTFDTPTPTTSGFSVQVANYDSSYTYSVLVNPTGAVTISSTGLITVTGVSPNATATVTVSTAKAGYTNVSSTVSATALSVPDSAALTNITGNTTPYIDDTQDGDLWFINAYFNTTDTYGYAYINAGSTVTLSWHVTGTSGQALANAPVTLIDNLAYSNSSGTTWSSSALNTNPQGSLSGATDANGNVSFTMVNTNATSGTRPSDLTSASGAHANESNYPWTRVLLQVGSDTYTASPSTLVNQATSEVDLIIVPSQSGTTTTTTTTTTTVPITNYDTTPAGPLLWSESFTGLANTAPSSSIWTPEIGQGFGRPGTLPRWDYGTGEIETNTADAANVSLDGSGNLAINALCTTNCTSAGNGNWTSARISTAGKVNFEYGQLEARIKLPAGSFNWPAFWMLGENFFPNQSWPNCGELDVMEGLQNNSVDQATLHANYPSGGDWNGGGGVTMAAPLGTPLSAGYHTFGILWSPNEIQFLLDGVVWGSDTYNASAGTVTQVAGSYTNTFNIGGQVWPFNQPFFIILQDAIPAGTAAPNGSDGTMDVSWIKYYSYDGYGAVTN